MLNPADQRTHLDSGNPSWRIVWRTAFAIARRTGPVLSVMVRLGVPSYYGEIVTLSLVGRRTGKARPVSVAMVTLDDRRYVGAPNGTTAWIVNLAAMDIVMLTIGREPTLAVRPTPLELGLERDAVIRAAGRRGSVHVRPLYRASRGHVRRAGVYIRLDAWTPEHARRRTSRAGGWSRCPSSARPRGSP